MATNTTQNQTFNQGALEAALKAYATQSTQLAAPTSPTASNSPLLQAQQILGNMHYLQPGQLASRNNTPVNEANQLLSNLNYLMPGAGAHVALLRQGWTPQEINYLKQTGQVPPTKQANLTNGQINQQMQTPTNIDSTIQTAQNLLQGQQF